MSVIMKYHHFKFWLHSMKCHHHFNLNSASFRFASSSFHRPATKSTQFQCSTLLKRGDYEGYLSSLLIDNRQTRRFAIALRAFNLEIAQIRDQAHSENTPALRFAFWDEALDRMFNRQSIITPAEVVAYELNQCLQTVDFKISKRWFQRLIDTRRQHLSSFPFDTLAELEMYCENSISPVYLLLTEFHTKLTGDELLLRQQLHLDHVANHLGRAHGLANILRGISFNAQRNRCYVPSELLSKHGCSHENILRQVRLIVGAGGQSKKASEYQKLDKPITDAMFDLASTAVANLNKVQKILKERQLSGRSTSQLFLPTELLDRYLKRLQRIDFNVLDPSLNKRDGLLPLFLWWKSRR